MIHLHFNLRSAAFAVLLLTFVSLCGAPLAEAAIFSAGTADSCCFPAEQGGEVPQSPCTTPDCPCLFCLNLHLPHVAEVSFLPISSNRPICHPHSFALAAFVRPLDYPPEYA